MTQHTPGPWAVDSDLPPNGRVIFLRLWPDEENIGISMHDQTGEHVISDAEARANAVLISNAPTMLAAIRTTLARHDDGHHNLEVGCVEMLRAVVAMATRDGPYTEAEIASLLRERTPIRQVHPANADATAAVDRCRRAATQNASSVAFGGVA